MNKKSKFLHTPPGARPFYKEEALFRYKIEKSLFNYFDKWGYFLIETPTIDYYDIYTAVFPDNAKKALVKFINRDGEIILLRNDVAVFAAKLVASRLTENTGLLRYFYSDSIIKNDKDSGSSEYHQIGCEIVGELSNLQEIEILIILLESVKDLGIIDFTLHIGDISFYEKLLKNLNEEDFNIIIDFIRQRDIEKLDLILKELKVAPEIIDDCLIAAGFIGNISDLKKLKISHSKYLSNLIQIGEMITSLGYESNIVFDLSELPKINYYSGIIFNLYAKGAETPLASGGRYDKLFEKMGVNKDACGFCFWLYPIEKILNKTTDNTDEKVLKIKLNTKNFKESFHEAINSTKNNKKINLEY